MQDSFDRAVPRPRQHLKDHRERVLAWPQTKAAERIGVHPSTVWRWETGLITTIRPYDLQLIANAYGLDYVALLRAEAERSSPTRATAVTWDVRGTVEAFHTLEGSHLDHPLAGLRAGEDLTGLARDWLSAEPVDTTAHEGTTRVGSDLVDQLESMVLRLRHLDDEIGGVDLLPIVRQRHQRVTRLLGGSYGGEVGRRLHATAADLGQLLGWLAFDAGQHGFAQRQWVAALHAAHSAGAPEIGANVLAGLALQAYAMGHPHDALSLAQTAEEGLGPDASSTVRAMLVSRQAVAAAKLGDRSTSTRAMNRAEDLLDEEDPAPPPWIYYYGRADEQLHAGTCWMALGEAERAEDAFAEALGRIDPAHVRDRGVLLARIARARIERHEIESAAQAATESLLLAAAQLHSLRAADELADVDTALSRFLGSVPAARDFHERYLDLLAAQPG